MFFILLSKANPTALYVLVRGDIDESLGASEIVSYYSSDFMCKVKF
jgi:hypothetical protein